jgi:hypothetical protein
MGIDAEMFVRVKRQVPDSEIRALRLAIGGAFGHGRFWISKKTTGEARMTASEEWDDSANRHMLERVTVYEQDGPSLRPAAGETFLRVYLTTRFYGVGYERGDLPFILTLARFLRDSIPGGEVWYGGDSSGVRAEPLDEAMEKSLWDHFVRVQHEPYQTAFSRLADDSIPTPVCAFCATEMRNYGGGGGGNYGAFACRGCGADVVTTDGGKTFSVRTERD